LEGKKKRFKKRDERKLIRKSEKGIVEKVMMKIKYEG
jgi:hypothetical protein